MKNYRIELMEHTHTGRIVQVVEYTTRRQLQKALNRFFKRMNATELKRIEWRVSKKEYFEGMASGYYWKKLYLSASRSII